MSVLENGEHYLIETKGREDPDVPRKDRAAELWCQYVTELTGTKWQYVKVPQRDFNRLQPSDFSDLKVFRHEQGTL